MKDYRYTITTSLPSSLEHKKDLINRLKQNDTHNIPTYEAEMSHHMTLQEDVLERFLNILKQDDYYRTLEDLPAIMASQHMMTSGSFQNYMTPLPSSKESQVRQI